MKLLIGILLLYILCCDNYKVYGYGGYCASDGVNYNIIKKVTKSGLFKKAYKAHQFVNGVKYRSEDSATNTKPAYTIPIKLATKMSFKFRSKDNLKARRISGHEIRKTILHPNSQIKHDRALHTTLQRYQVNDNMNDDVKDTVGDQIGWRLYECKKNNIVQMQIACIYTKHTSFATANYYSKHVIDISGRKDRIEDNSQARDPILDCIFHPRKGWFSSYNQVFGVNYISKDGIYVENNFLSGNYDQNAPDYMNGMHALDKIRCEKGYSVTQLQMFAETLANQAHEPCQIWHHADSTVTTFMNLRQSCPLATETDNMIQNRNAREEEERKEKKKRREAVISGLVNLISEIPLISIVPKVGKIIEGVTDLAASVTDLCKNRIIAGCAVYKYVSTLKNIYDNLNEVVEDFEKDDLQTLSDRHDSKLLLDSFINLQKRFMNVCLQQLSHNIRPNNRQAQTIQVANPNHVATKLIENGENNNENGENNNENVISDLRTQVSNLKTMVKEEMKNQLQLKKQFENLKNFGEDALKKNP